MKSIESGAIYKFDPIALRLCALEFDTTHQSLQVPFTVHHRRAVAPFPHKAPLRPVMLKDCTSPANRLKDLADRLASFRGCQHLELVSRPDLGMDRQAVLDSRIHQDIAKTLIVRICDKDHLPVVATLDDVPGLSGDDETGKAFPVV
ncbi:MAG: hypothetical protein ACRERU_23920 [Methylococcales bacterium]